jgi:hypothetical protein
MSYLQQHFNYQSGEDYVQNDGWMCAGVIEAQAFEGIYLHNNNHHYTSHDTWMHNPSITLKALYYSHLDMGNLQA